MKKKHVILTISLCVLLLILSNYAIAQTSKEQQLTQEQIEAFRSAETVRIVVESYQDDKSKEVKNVNMLIEALVGKISKFFGLQVLSPDAKNYDLEIKIKTRFIPYLLVKEKIKIPENRLKGSISFEMVDIPIYTKAFNVHIEDIYPRTNLELIKEYRTIFSKDSVLYHLMIGFEFAIIFRLGEIFGISGVIARLKDENVTIRKYAAISLGYLYDQRAIEPLIAALKDEDKDVRVVVVNSLAHPLVYLDELRVVESLIEALKDEAKDVRVAVVKSLHDLLEYRAVEPLIAALKDEDKDVRVAAAEALGDLHIFYFYKVGKVPAVEPLIAALKDEDKDVRVAVAEALGNLHNRRAVEPLIAALKDEDKDVRVAVVNALVHPLVYLDELRVVESLIEALKDEDKDVRMRIDDALHSITGKSFNGSQKKWQEWWEKNKEKFF